MTQNIIHSRVVYRSFIRSSNRVFVGLHEFLA